MRHIKTGGRRLAELIEKGVPFRSGVYLDTYNQIYNMKVFGTLKVRTDQNNMYFVTQAYETK